MYLYYIYIICLIKDCTHAQFYILQYLHFMTLSKYWPKENIVLNSPLHLFDG